jgi:hypothetical protein
VIYGSETPRRSLAEIEEFADETVEAITPFLQ